MKKQLLLLVMMLLPMVAWGDPVKINGIWYNFVWESKMAEVTNKSLGEYSGAIVIPEKVTYNSAEYSVTSIGKRAFSNCIGLTSVTIPNSVTTIGSSAFYYCKGLTSITIPKSVRTIGDHAFYECIGLTSITIPNSVMTIEWSAFEGCSGLTSVTIPNNVTSIGNSAFRYCSGLTSITIPNSVTTIGSSAFYGCTGLTSITIPNSVKSIGNYAFSNCIGLTSITIPNSVRSIGDHAFSECSGLTSITIGNGVRSIGSKAFANCHELTDVTCMAEKVPSTDSDAFVGSYIDYGTLHVPGTAIDAYKTTEPWSSFENVEKIVMPTHRLTYIVDEEEYISYEIEEGASITPEAEPTKEGYTFSGWSEIPETMPAEDVIITGTFTVNKYKLTYKVDGEEYKTSEVEYGAAITAEDEPTKEGYTFSGWSEIPETMPAEDVIITGTFTVNKYKLTYKVDGEDYKTSEVEYGAAITAEDEPTKEGYTFSGWSEIPETMPAEDVVITGTFTINSYTITYKIDDEVFMTESVEYGSTITPPDAPEKEGYTFEWIDVPEKMPAKDITIVGSYTSGIGSVYVEDGDVKWYTLEGKRIETPRKGLNIMKKSNGKTKKVLVK